MHTLTHTWYMAGTLATGRGASAADGFCWIDAKASCRSGRLFTHWLNGTVTSAQVRKEGTSCEGEIDKCCMDAKESWRLGQLFNHCLN